MTRAEYETAKREQEAKLPAVDKAVTMVTQVRQDMIDEVRAGGAAKYAEQFARLVDAIAQGERPHALVRDLIREISPLGDPVKICVELRDFFVRQLAKYQREFVDPEVGVVVELARK